MAQEQSYSLLIVHYKHEKSELFEGQDNYPDKK
jgi:hypothetical protein